MNRPNFYLPLLSLDPRQATVLIEIIQKDAYNQAVEDSLENVTASIDYDYSGNRDEYCDETAVVNKQSIYKLLKK